MMLEGLTIDFGSARLITDMAPVRAVQLRPMLVQYLVGLCSLRWNPGAVEVVLGDMVLDVAAAKERDVDITVLIREQDSAQIVIALEVKREKRPLDVDKVEALCQKLADMPAVMSRGIVSTSGYTDGAINKAAAHDVVLFEMKSVEQLPAESFRMVPQMGGLRSGQFYSTQLYWESHNLWLWSDEGPTTFSIADDEKILTETGAQHPRFEAFRDLRDDVLVRSLIPLQSDASVTDAFNEASFAPVDANGFSHSKSWSAERTVSVTHEKAYVGTSSPFRLDSVKVSGTLRVRRCQTHPAFYVVREVASGDLLAAACVTEGTSEGDMYALTFLPESNKMSVNMVHLTQRQLNAIRKLRLEPTD